MKVTLLHSAQNEKIAEVENSNLSIADKASQIQILRDAIETIREIQ